MNADCSSGDDVYEKYVIVHLNTGDEWFVYIKVGAIIYSKTSIMYTIC